MTHQVSDEISPEVVDEIPQEIPQEIPYDDLVENGKKPIRSSGGKKRIGLALIGVLLLTAVGFLVIRNLATPKLEKAGRYGAKGQQVTPVTVATVIQKTVPLQLQAVGNVQSSSTVSVTPQASGIITGVYFQKGQEVSKDATFVYT